MSDRDGDRQQTQASSIPQVVRNRYRVHRALGQGGGGSVFEVEDLCAHREGRPHLALKVVEAAAGREDLVALLQREFRTLASLRHPWLARVHDFGRMPGWEGAGRAYFFTRDLIDGVDLQTFCRGRTLAEVCLILAKTAEVLDVLHRTGMIHGDFKPANVIVAANGQPHLIDFGLVKGEGERAVPSGTALYMAPEFLRGSLVDRRSDLYAFGISIYQLVVGRLPVEGTSISEIIAWHLDGRPLQLSSIREDVPAALNEVVSRLTERDPDDRFPNASELARALGRAIGLAEPREQAVSVFVPPAFGESSAATLERLEQLTTVGGAGAQRSSHVVSVVAAPGGGKSRLLREYAWRMQVAGYEVLRATFHGGESRAYGVLSDLALQVGALVGVESPLCLHPAPGPDGPESARYRMFQRLTDFLQQAAERLPIVLLFDDLDCADQESREALRFIAHALNPKTPLTLIAAHKPDRALTEILGHAPEIVVPPLAQTEIEMMLSEAAGRADQALARSIAEHTAGNPAHVLHCFRLLFEERWPPNPDLGRLAPLQDAEEFYRDRWRDLCESDRRVLEAIAVAGYPASADQLRFLLERGGHSSVQGADQLQAVLIGLEQAGWLSRDRYGQWTFCQGAATPLVYSLVPANTRELLHCAAADWSERDDDSLAERVHHLFRAKRTRQGLSLLEPAVAQLRALAAHRRAISLLCDALEVVGDDEPATAQKLHCERAQFSFSVGEYERAISDFEESTVGPDGLLRVKAQIGLARVCRAAGLGERALSVIEDALSNAAIQVDRLALVCVKAAVLATQDAHAQVLAVVEQALAVSSSGADEPGVPALRAELLARQARSMSYLQNYDEASRVFAVARADAERTGDKRVEAEVLNAWAIAAHRQAEYESVGVFYEAAYRCSAELGDVGRMAEIRLNQGTLHLQRGELAACRQYLTPSRRMFEAMGADYMAACARCNEGYLLIKLGLLEEARDTLGPALVQVRRLGRPSGEALALVLLALVDGGQGRIDPAREGIRRARELYLGVGQARDAADALLDLAELELVLGNASEVERALGDLGQEMQLELAQDLELRAAALAAQLAAQPGREASRPEAMLRLGRAMEQAERLGSLELRWICCFSASELAHAERRATAAAEYASRGVEILARMADDLPNDVAAAFWQDPRRRIARTRARYYLRQSRMEMAQHEKGMALWDTADEASLVGRSAAERRPDAERFYRLLEIYRRINSELDQQRLLGLVMDTAVELTGAERGFLLLGPSADELTIEVARNLDPRSEAVAYSRSIAERVYRSGQPVVTVSAHNDPRFSAFPSVHNMQLESVLCIPVHATDRICGVLYMESRFQSGRFSADDQRLLMAFGDQVAISLTNARLLAENVRKAQELMEANQRIEALAEDRRRLLEERTAQLEQANRDLVDAKRQLETRAGMFGIIGRSEPMRRLFQVMERVTSVDIPVLVEGESGTGKEMVARAIHQGGPRSKRRLVSINCAAIPENLLESELFGHVRGAFTGADRERKGLFQAADGGTLFLDEIGEMPMRMQVDLLRALQEQTIRPVGSEKDVRVDVRIIAASNKPLQDLVRQGLFREDLFYRLHVVRIDLPPLRARTEDIPLLVDHFLARIAKQMNGVRRALTRQALGALIDYPWPGNVRQLEHTLLNAVVLAEREVIDLADLTLEAPGLARSAATGRAGGHLATEEKAIREALERCGWNRSRAAEALGMPRRTFYRRLKSFGLL
jgi:transcriptional regulator with GAF, ATPase, and Fis domain/serine/threonine protein kinase